MLEMARRDILPAALRYSGDLAAAAAEKQALSIGRPVLFGRPAPFKGSYLYNDNSIRYSLIKELKALGITGHLPHDGRHTFSTLAKKAGMDDYARKKLMGHSIKDLTDKVYTHLDMEWFRQELEKIK